MTKDGAESTGLLKKPESRQHVDCKTGEEKKWEIDAEMTIEGQKTKGPSQQSLMLSGSWPCPWRETVEVAHSWD